MTANTSSNGKSAGNKTSPDPAIKEQLGANTEQAERTRKNAIKQFRTTATRLRKQAKDAPEAVKQQSELLARNLESLADQLNARTVEQGPVPVARPEPPRRTVDVPVSPPPNTENIAWAAVGSFIGGLLLGLITRRR
jgi:hypothetical protein